MQTSSEDLGLNRTGVKISPKDSREAMEGAQSLTRPPQGGKLSLSGNRQRYMREAEAIGTVPLPASLKGAFSDLQEKIMNGDHTFMDKLGERIGFERSGTRLYEALLSKYQGSDEKSGFPDIKILQRFLQEEKDHFNTAARIMEEIGGDCTAMTPAADVAAVASMGWIQAITDPRTSFKQSLEVILQAELVDNASWELLISLAQDVGLKDVASEFQRCLDEEAVHLSTIKQWVQELNLKGKVEAKLVQ